MKRIDELASEGLIDTCRRVLPPAVAASLMAEDAETAEEADARIKEELAEEARRIAGCGWDDYPEPSASATERARACADSPSYGSDGDYSPDDIKKIASKLKEFEAGGGRSGFHGTYHLGGWDRL